MIDSRKDSVKVATIAMPTSPTTMEDSQSATQQPIKLLQQRLMWPVTHEHSTLWASTRQSETMSSLMWLCTARTEQAGTLTSRVTMVGSPSKKVLIRSVASKSPSSALCDNMHQLKTRRLRNRRLAPCVTNRSLEIFNRP